MAEYLGYGKLDMRYNNEYSKLLRKGNHRSFFNDYISIFYNYDKADFESIKEKYFEYIESKGYKYFADTECKELKKAIEAIGVEEGKDIREAGDRSLETTRRAFVNFFKKECFSCMYEYSSRYIEVLDAFKRHLEKEGYLYKDSLLERRLKKWAKDNFIQIGMNKEGRLVMTRVRLLTSEEDKIKTRNGRELKVSVKGEYYN